MKLLCNCLSNCLSNCFNNIFCCKNKIVEINPPSIRRDNKPEFVNENEENYKNEDNEIYFKYIKFNTINTKKNSYNNSNYDDFDYNQPLPDIPQQSHLTIPLKIKQEIIYNTNLIFSNTEDKEDKEEKEEKEENKEYIQYNCDIIVPPPLPPKVKRENKNLKNYILV